MPQSYWIVGQCPIPRRSTNNKNSEWSVKSLSPGNESGGKRRKIKKTLTNTYTNLIFEGQTYLYLEIFQVFLWNALNTYWRTNIIFISNILKYYRNNENILFFSQVLICSHSQRSISSLGNNLVATSRKYHIYVNI